jgi:hypothetical protein
MCLATIVKYTERRLDFLAGFQDSFTVGPDDIHWSLLQDKPG